jgi:hypothetical protein
VLAYDGDLENDICRTFEVPCRLSPPTPLPSLDALCRLVCAVLCTRLSRPEKKSHLLIPNGDNVPLTKHNRESFVQV